MCQFFAKYNNIMLKNAINIYNNQELSEKFKVLSQLLIQDNAKYNLTAIKDEDLIQDTENFHPKIVSRLNVSPQLLC